MQNLIMDCFTVALLVMPSEAVKGVSHDGLDLRLSLYRVAEALHLSHYRSWGDTPYMNGVHWLRSLATVNSKYPGPEWLDQMPPLEDVEVRLDMAVAFDHYLRSVRNTWPAEKWHRAREETSARLAIYHEMKIAMTSNRWDYRRDSLNRIRVWMGDEAFVRGEWPTPVPLEFVQDR